MNDLVRAAESIDAAIGTLAEGLEGHLEALNAPLIALRAALAANEKVPSRATDIATALALPGCERLREWAEIGPVQMAAVEEFAYALAANVPADLRNAFEALAVQLSTLTLERDEAGRYVSAVQQMLWESFQVRRATAPAPAPEAEPAQAQAGEAVPQGPHTEFVLNELRSALNAMLTFFGMDEDESSKAVFDKARQAYDYAQIVMRPLEPWERQSLEDFRACVGSWHEKAVAKGYDGVESMCDTAPAQAQQSAELLPCPFCGSHVIAREGYHMICLTCGAEGTDADEATDNAAAAAWNRRAKAKPEAQQAEAAARQVKRYEPEPHIVESNGRLKVDGAGMMEKPDGRWVRFTDCTTLAATKAKPEAQQAHRYTIGLPADDPRTARVWWSDRTEAGGVTTHALCVCITEAKPEAQQSSDYQRGWDACMAVWADHMKRMNEALERPLPEGYANHAHHLYQRVRGALNAAPLEAKPEAQQSCEPYTSERHFALREGHCIGASDDYFNANNTHDNDAGRMLFERGYVRGFDKATELADSRAAQAKPEAHQADGSPVDLRALAELAGISMDGWDMGAASIAYSEGCHGITRAHLEKFAGLVGFECWNRALVANPAHMQGMIHLALRAAKPAQAQPLTDAQIVALFDANKAALLAIPGGAAQVPTYRQHLVRMVERAHGIGASGEAS